MDRSQSLLGPIHKGMKIIEIGPGYNPAVPKSDGWNSFSIDHVPKEELIKKYTGQMPIDRIEDVDFIWKSGPLESAVPADLHGTFDACIASHVIEHTPDMVAFLNSISCLLKKDGILALAIPDKRAMFDLFQTLTLTDKVIEAHIEKRTRHTRATAFSNRAYNIKSDGFITWSPGQRVFNISICDDHVTAQGLPTAFNFVRDISTDPSSPYIDFHAWRLTPASFKLLAVELTACNIFPFTIEFVSETIGCEFFVHLRNRLPPSSPAADVNRLRMDLLQQIILEKRSEVDSIAGIEIPEAIHVSHPSPVSHPRNLRNLWRFLLKKPMQPA